MKAADTLVLRELERLLGLSVPRVARFDYRHFGYQEEDGRVTALERLSLGGNALRELPGWVSELTALRSLNLSGNPLVLPGWLRKRGALEELYLFDLGLEELPERIGGLTGLRRLAGRGARIRR